MMKKHTKKIISIALCICMFLGMVWNSGGLEALATSLNLATSDPAKVVHKADPQAAIGTAANPFMVLEIVPTLDQAQFGYFIPGCEPVDLNKIEAAYNTVGAAFSLFKDAYTVTEYEEYALYEKIPADTLYGIALGGEINLDPNPYRSRTDLKYENTGYGNWYMNRDDPNCRVKGYFEKVESGTGEFKLEQPSGYNYPYNAAPQGDNYHFVYAPGKGDYVWYTSDAGEDGDPDKIWMERDDVFKCHRAKLQHNDDFIKHVFGTSSESFQSEVITMTPELLKDNMSLIDEADLIIIRTAQHTSVTSQLWNFASDHKDATGKLEQGEMGTFAQHDLTNAETIAIMRRMASSNPAALIMEMSTMRAAGAEMNVSKLTYMALQYDPVVFCMKYMDQVEKDSEGHDKLYYSGAKDENLKYYWSCDTFRYESVDGVWVDRIDEMRYYSAVSADNNVMDKIFTYNGNGFDIQHMLSKDNIAGADGAYTRYTKEWLESYGEDPSNPGKHTLLDAVEFILGRSSTYQKQKLRILEIQPCNRFIYGSKDWKVYYQSLFPWLRPESSETSWMDDPKLLKVDTMPIWEFIGSTGTYDYDWGKNKLLTCESSDDLISKYDLIIIGANQDETSGVMNNDWTLSNDLIYSGVGDRVVADGNVKDWGKTSVLISSGARYAPIDLTLKKLLELQDFTAAGKPIVVDGGLYNNWDRELNIYKVDKESKLYEFLNGKDSDDGIFIRKRLSTTKLKNSLLKSLCRLELAEGGYPTEYVGNESGGTLVETYNASSTLSYKFRIVADTTAAKDTTYTVSLNTDKNGDGVYGGSLKQRSEVDNMRAATKDSTLQYDQKETAVKADKYLNIKGDSGRVKNGELKANTWYEISYKLPSAQKGIVPWKLEIASTGNEKLRASAIDYTLIKCSDKDKVRINVLQMNLTPDMTDAAYQDYSTFFTTNVVDIGDDKNYRTDYEYTEHNKALKYELNEGQNHTVQKFAAYLAPVKEFNVHMQFMYNEDWKTLFDDNGKTKAENLSNWKDFLGKYDMLIFGFQDGAMFTANEVFQEGLDDYIAQGKSVIFSHDMVQSWMTNGYRATYKDTPYQDANEWLRTTAGQRSDTYTRQSDGSYKRIENKSEYCDNALQLMLRACSDYSGRNSINPEDLTRDKSNGKYLSRLPKLDRISKLAETKEYRGWYTGDGLLETSFVKIANNGQITTYPYNISDQIEVLQTHVQNYALNLEYIEDGDVNVWYNLTDSSDEDIKNSGLLGNGQKTASGREYNVNDVYSAKDGDCRNNFYIYNKGNITYTGLGHGKSRETEYYAYMTDDEIKLFVNTMISAYRQPEGAPFAVVENADATSGSSSIYYLDYNGGSNVVTDGGLVYDGRVIYENGKPYLKVQCKIEDDSANPDAEKRYYLYFMTDGDVKEYRAVGTGAALTVTDVAIKTASGDNGKGYEVPKGYIDSEDQEITVYIPYEDITSRNGQLSMSLCVYATYPKNGKIVSTIHSKTEVTTMYLPLFDLN